MSLKIQGGIVNINEYHDNSREYHIDARGKDLASVMRAIEAEDITPSEDSSNYSDCQSDIPSSPASDNRPEDILPIPKEGKYTKVREYIKERSRFDAEFKTFVQERSLRDLCSRLTKEFGWFVDEHSLGSNMNRHRKD